MFLPISGCTGCHARGPFFATEVLRRIAAFFSADLRSDVPKGDIWPSSYGAQVMRAGSIAALSGIAGFAVGWITRPLLEVERGSTHLPGAGIAYLGYTAPASRARGQSDTRSPCPIRPVVRRPRVRRSFAWQRDSASRPTYQRVAWTVTPAGFTPAEVEGAAQHGVSCSAAYFIGSLRAEELDFLAQSKYFGSPTRCHCHVVWKTDAYWTAGAAPRGPIKFASLPHLAVRDAGDAPCGLEVIAGE